MKMNKYISLAALAVAFTSCQEDTLVQDPQQSKIYTLSAVMNDGAAMSRAQIQLGNTDASVGEIFFWNEGDSFTLYQGENDSYTEHVFTIKDYSEEGEGDKKTASFVTNSPVFPGEVIGVYPSGMPMDYDQEIMKVGMDFQTELDFGQGTVEEVWKDYFRNNLVMKTKATLTEGGNNTLQFEHLTSLARITYHNQSGQDQNVTEIVFGGDQTFGYSKTVWFKYDIIGGNSSNGYRINYKNLIVKAGESFDFYILFGPNDFREGDMHIHIHTAQTDINRSPLALPTSTIAAANNGAEGFEAGKRYWFNVTEKPEGLAWTNNANIGNTGLLAVISKVYPDLVTKNSDGTYTVNQDKAAEVVELALSGQGTFESLDGIENFPNLERLFCDNVGLKTLDISNNQKLKQIEVVGNDLISLNFSSNPALEIIQCHHQNNNSLRSLDVTGNINLKTLGCQNNTLTSLDLTKNVNLEWLDCGVNELSSLNLENNLKLRELLLACNDLTSLDMSKHQNLTYLHCTENHITTLDITKNTNLKTLNCGNQQPDGTEITVRMTEAQKELWDASWSKIEYWNSRYVNVVVVEADSDLITIQNAELSTALQAVLGAVNVKLENGYAVMTKAFAESVETLNFTSKYTITSLRGIENFTGLRVLTCARTGLTECDLSKNTKLQRVSIYGNNLTFLDFSNNTALTNINCAQNNSLQTLKIDNCTKLTNLIIDDTQLQSISIPNPGNIRQLAYSGTSLNLDLTQFKSLQILFCNYNNLTTINLTPEQKLQLTDLECEGNQLTSLDLKQYPNLQSLNCVSNQLTELNVSESPKLTFLRCAMNRLTSIDLSALTNLEELDIIRNELTSLDVSKLTKLKGLCCQGNMLKTLDLTNCTSLEGLQCGEQTDLNGKQIPLELKLADNLLDLWENQWKSDGSNADVILSTAPSVEPGNGNTGGNDFTIEGIY